MQRDVAAQFEERENVPLDLTCDQDMAVETGATYTCQGTTGDDEDVTITIRITDDGGAYEWSE